MSRLTDVSNKMGLQKKEKLEQRQSYRVFLLAIILITAHPKSETSLREIQRKSKRNISSMTSLPYLCESDWAW